MLYFRREVECQFRKPVMHRPSDPKRVCGSIQKVRVPKGYVPRAGGHKSLNVFDNDLFGNDKEPAVVHRWDRAMRAVMQAPAARFHVTYESFLTVVLELRVVLQRYQRPTGRR